MEHTRSGTVEGQPISKPEIKLGLWIPKLLLHPPQLAQRCPACGNHTKCQDLTSRRGKVLAVCLLEKPPRLGVFLLLDVYLSFTFFIYCLTAEFLYY